MRMIEETHKTNEPVFGKGFSKKASGDRGFKSHPPHHEQTYPTLAFPEQFNII